MAQTIFIICLSGFTVTSEANGTKMARGMTFSTHRFNR